MKKLSLTLLLLSTITLADSSMDEFKDEAQKVLMPIKRAFMKELKVGMKDGPYETVSSCHLKAPHILEGDFNAKYELGRTSPKIRNSENTPKEWLKDILAEYAKSNMEKPMDGKVYKIQDKLAYVEPIYVQPVCLKCHGELHGSVKKKIDELYPKDMATGYKVGDFRGLFYLKQR